ncbi:MAG: hypothetical protein C1941_00805 [Prosthecochloris sp.]|nr:hypothetical protein [Prosthecochloris sp.]
MKKILFLCMSFPPMMTEGASRAFKFASCLPSLGWEPVVIGLHSVSGPEIEQVPFEIYYAGKEYSTREVDAGKLFRIVHGLSEKKFSVRGFSGSNGLGSVEKNWLKKAKSLARKALDENPDIEMIYAQAPSFAPNRLEKTIMHSGHCVTMPSRELKELFLRKYQGEIFHDDISIVKNGYDPEALQLCGAEEEQGGLMRWVFHVDRVDRGNDLKRFFSALSSLVSAQPAVRGVFSFAFTGSGSRDVRRYAKKYGLEDLIEADAVWSYRHELELWMGADIICLVLGSAEGNGVFIPERLFDTPGMQASIAGIVPDGLSKQCILDVGGRTVPIDQSEAIAGFLQESFTLWRSRQLPVVREAATESYHIRSTMQDFIREVAVRLPVA